MIAACLLKDEEIIAAAQEERFTGKNMIQFPCNAIQYTERSRHICKSTNDVFCEKPFVKFERLLETYLAFAPKGFITLSKAMPLRLKTTLSEINLLINSNQHFKQTLIGMNEFCFLNIIYLMQLVRFIHHLLICCSANSDGVGEWTTSYCNW